MHPDSSHKQDDVYNAASLCDIQFHFSIAGLRKRGYPYLTLLHRLLSCSVIVLGKKPNVS